MQIRRVVIFSIIAIALVGCQRTKLTSIEDSAFQAYFENTEIPKVTGRIINLTEEEISNTELDYAIVTPFEPSQIQIKKTGILNQDGSFSLEIDYPFPYQQIWLHVGDFFYAGIYANKDLFIELDADSMRDERAYMYGPGVRYSGTDGKLNEILNKHVLFRREEQLDIRKSVSLIRRDRSLEDKVALRKYDSLYILLHAIDEEFVNENPSPYSHLVNNERLSDYYGDICIRFWGMDHDKMPKELFYRIISHKAFLISNNGSTFYNYMLALLEAKSGKYEPINYSNFSGYTKLNESQRKEVDEYSKLNIRRDSGESYDTVKYNNLRKSINRSLADTIVIARTLKTANYLDSIFNKNKADFLKMKLSSRDPEERALILETLLGHTNTEWVKNILKAKYEETVFTQTKIKEVLKEGESFAPGDNIGEPLMKLPFGADLYIIKQIEPDVLLAKIKSAFKGKDLILDFWATWCAPCLSDLPYSKKLHDQMNGESVEFIYLCTSAGSDIEEWKSKIIELELGGTHLFVDNSTENGLMAMFNFGGFPSYAFINSNGDYNTDAITSMSHLTIKTLKNLMEDK